MDSLDKLKTDITDSYSKGKINEKHYERLNNEISMLYEEIFRKRIESKSNYLENINSKEHLDKLKNDIEKAYSKGKINELHYGSLKNEISLLHDKIFRKNIASLKQSSDGKISEQLTKLKENIEIAQTEQKITETQFNLLNKKLSNLEDDGKLSK
jgi:hypothetical protein